MNTGIVNVTQAINRIDDVNAITIIGDPGCDGLGAGTMSIFARALTAVPSELTLIVGDIVHRGIKPLYATVRNFVDSVSPNPVYMVCGNHDTAFYDEYFGLRNYLLYNDKLLLIALDNSTRDFSPAALQLLETGLNSYARQNIVLLFHYPAPNTIATNTINPPEWEKIAQIISPYRDRLRFLIAGHVHSYYEDVVDGVKLLVTGGGGARIEHVNDKIDPTKAHHHIIRLYFDANDILQYEHVPLHSTNYTRELEDDDLKARLEESLENEAVAHIKYRLLAVDAEEKGFPGLAKMFRAFADSEFFHARNHFFVLNNMGTIAENLQRSQEQEHHEITVMYKEHLAVCDEKNYGLARYSFYDSHEAEKVHEKLLVQAIGAYQRGEDMTNATYHTCTSCGYTFTGAEHPKHCPICGAPADKIRKVE